MIVKIQKDFPYRTDNKDIENRGQEQNQHVHHIRTQL